MLAYLIMYSFCALAPCNIEDTYILSTAQPICVGQPVNLPDRENFVCMQMRVSLSELDRWFEYILAGKTYHGEAITPRTSASLRISRAVGKVNSLAGRAPDFGIYPGSTAAEPSKGAVETDVERPLTCESDMRLDHKSY